MESPAPARTSIWDHFRGHEPQREMFRRAISRGRLSQSYLFVGPAGIGKFRFARLLAQSLLCQERDREPLEACGICASCRPFVAGNHPDFLVIERIEGKREILIGQIAGPKEQRGQVGLCHDLSLTPLHESRKVAIVNDAETMNEESANAFLKTLEEPPDRAVLILVAANLDAVLPTIRSRCQLIRFQPLSRSDLESLLVEQEIVATADEAAAAARYAEGSLTTARQLLRPEMSQLRSQIWTELSQRDVSGPALAKSLVQQLETLASDVPTQREYAHWLLRFTIEFYSAALHGDIHGAASEVPEVRRWLQTLPPRCVAHERISQLIERTMEAEAHLEQYIPISLILDALYDELARLGRR